VAELGRQMDEVRGKIKSVTDQLDKVRPDRVAAEKGKELAEKAKAAIEVSLNKVVNQLETLRQQLDPLHALLQRFPVIPQGINPGEWTPETVTLIVNGKEIGPFTVKERLRQGHPAWRKYLRSMPPTETFANSLRLRKQAGGDVIGSLIAEF